MSRDPSEDLHWELLESEEGPDLGLFRARFDRLRHPVSGHAFRRLVLEAGDWVNCVARTPEGTLVMVEQYRFGIGALTLESPAGMVDPGEDPLTAIRRELREETGYGGGEWTYLGAVEPNPAFLPNLCHHYLADGVTPEGPPEPGAGEHLRVVEMDLEELRAAVRSGRVRHSLALSGLSRVYDLFDGVG